MRKQCVLLFAVLMMFCLSGCGMFNDIKKGIRDVGADATKTVTATTNSFNADLAETSMESLEKEKKKITDGVKAKNFGFVALNSIAGVFGQHPNFGDVDGQIKTATAEINGKIEAKKNLDATASLLGTDNKGLASLLRGGPVILIVIAIIIAIIFVLIALAKRAKAAAPAQPVSPPMTYHGGRNRIRLNI